MHVVAYEHDSYTSWNVLDFISLEDSRTWKVLENHCGPGKFWKLKLKVLESHGKISLKVMHFSKLLLQSLHVYRDHM